LTFISICLIAYISGDLASDYYAGLILVMIGICLIIPYTLKEALIECSVIILCYSVTVGLLPNNALFNFEMFFNNLYFIVLALFIGITGVYQLSKNRIVEFNQRYDLKKANRIKKEKCKRLEEALTQIKSLQVKVLQEEKMKTMGIVTASVIHEINGHLSYVGLYAAKLKIDFKGDPKLQRKVDSVYEGVKQIERIGKDLRKFAGGGNMLIELFSLYEIITSALIYASNKSDNIKVNKVVEENIYVAGYPGELLQLFLNLLINASDALNTTDKKEKRIDIICSEKNKRVSVKFRDNGPGIEKEKINKLFTPFFTTKTAGKGMGLGLSICANIVKRHEDELKVESKEGRRIYGI